MSKIYFVLFDTGPLGPLFKDIYLADTLTKPDDEKVFFSGLLSARDAVSAIGELSSTDAVIAIGNVPQEFESLFSNSAAKRADLTCIPPVERWDEHKRDFFRNNDKGLLASLVLAIAKHRPDLAKKLPPQHLQKLSALENNLLCGTKAASDTLDSIKQNLRDLDFEFKDDPPFTKTAENVSSTQEEGASSQKKEPSKPNLTFYRFASPAAKRARAEEQNKTRPFQPAPWDECLYVQSTGNAELRVDTVLTSTEHQCPNTIWIDSDPNNRSIQHLGLALSVENIDVWRELTAALSQHLSETTGTELQSWISARAFIDIDCRHSPDNDVLNTLADFVFDNLLVNNRPVAAHRTTLGAAFVIENENRLSSSVMEEGKFTKFAVSDDVKNYYHNHLFENIWQGEGEPLSGLRSCKAETQDGITVTADAQTRNITTRNVHLFSDNVALVEWGWEEDVKPTDNKDEDWPRDLRSTCGQKTASSTTIGDVLDINDNARTLKAVYSTDDKKHHAEIKWSKEQTAVLTVTKGEKQDDGEENLKTFFSELLFGDEGHKECFSKRIWDERALVFSCVTPFGGVPTIPSAKHAWHAMLSRLMHVDSDGQGFPYSTATCLDDLKKAQYDRFAEWGTHFMVTSHSFTSLGVGEYAYKHIFKKHMRSEDVYGRLYQLAQVYRAELHDFERRISKATLDIKNAANHDQDKDKTQHTLFSDLRKQFLEFTNVLWFPEVTSQMQGQQINVLIWKETHLQSVFDFVREQISWYDDFLSIKRQKEVEKDRHLRKETQEKIKNIGIPLAVLVSVFSLSGVDMKDTFPIHDIVSTIVHGFAAVRRTLNGAAEATSVTPDVIDVFAASTIIVAFTLMATLRIMRKFDPPPSGWESPSAANDMNRPTIPTSMLNWTLGLFFLIGAGLFVCGWGTQSSSQAECPPNTLSVAPTGTQAGCPPSAPPPQDVPPLPAASQPVSPLQPPTTGASAPTLPTPSPHNAADKQSNPVEKPQLIENK